MSGLERVSTRVLRRDRITWRRNWPVMVGTFRHNDRQIVGGYVRIGDRVVGVLRRASIRRAAGK